MWSHVQPGAQSLSTPQSCTAEAAHCPEKPFAATGVKQDETAPAPVYDPPGPGLSQQT
jgi:hypothetical protein